MLYYNRKKGIKMKLFFVKKNYMKKILYLLKNSFCFNCD